MTDRITEIRARLEVAQNNRLLWSDHQPGTFAEFIAYAPADIAWLLNEVERLRRLEVSHLRSLVRKMSWGLAWRASARKWRKRALMYERVKS